ncbi:hypothetical protein TREMEDRAFT_36357 [Tremella mesenterica DSM 1558]|uniref:uncharacterized protein n=1 Tax=Tremella mesenterica (strain ATCC 24925 / CBS 8224 / DSM 1558 / NBRC 9311 / NRRL Y-6157 / RJB 2259-6 / UBC 559-6) TaxID=578456 RepID=UPI0003F49060|nr:uncharacterized protein TREMEDRAFT_36357 [Tremella mesenterica DSM 1558]EIW71954.1 hypothetical protein TREMEDRAFT_36357 [Tremella mesenterica DSM 1558]
MPFGASHKPLVFLAHSAIASFFRRIEVYGSDNVPQEGPIIFACSHANMAVDPSVLSSTVPHGYSLHYWVKDSLFKNPALGALLLNAGNIPVDRKTKNNQKLFRGTFEVLALGECIGVFPEGTSHTEPHLIPLKDGTSWAALEYVRYLLGTEENGGPKPGKKAVIVPVGIAYSDKSHYRSKVVVHYGRPIETAAYEEEFLSPEEGIAKNVVKRLTRTIEIELRKMTVNAPDWETAFAAQMARELLWEDEDALALTDFVDVSQTLVDLFTTTSNDRITKLKALLATYHRLLTSSRISNSALTDIPLPQTLDPSLKISLPSRFSPLWLLVKDSLVAAVQLPFFVVPLLTHLPVYIVGVLGARLVEDELETQAQMKIAFGLILSFLTYPVLFFTFWAMFRQFTLGVALAAGLVWLLGRYHSALIDPNYNAMKRLVAAWRILIGLWLPQQFDMPLPSFIASSSLFAPDPPKVAGLPPQATPEKYKRPKRLPSRVLVRHVLRIRLEAARELADVLLQLEQTDGELYSSPWLAESYGGEVLNISKEDEERLEWERPLPVGRRGGKEVVGFLRTKGGRLGLGHVGGHWAASDGEETDVKGSDEAS